MRKTDASKLLANQETGGYHNSRYNKGSYFNRKRAFSFTIDK
jgi:hypothetical protein